MPNNFCFHVYAQKSLFIAENCNVFFYHHITLSCEFRVHIAGSQLKDHGFAFNVLFCKWLLKQEWDILI